MFDCCCGSCGSGFLKDKLEYKIAETEKGIRIDVVPKDPEKRQVLQDLMKACQAFCGTESSGCC